MQVAYKLTESDLASFSRIVAYQTPRIWYAVILPLVCAMLLVLALLGAAWAGVSYFKPFLVIQPVMYLPIWVAIYPTLVNRQLTRRFQKTEGAFGPQTLSITPEGAHLQTSAGEREYGWQSFVGVIDGGAYFYLVLGPSDALIVPKRAFYGSQEARAFYTLAEAYKKNNRKPSASAWPPAPKSPEREKGAP